MPGHFPRHASVWVVFAFQKVVSWRVWLPAANVAVLSFQRGQAEEWNTLWCHFSSFRACFFISLSAARLSSLWNWSHASNGEVITSQSLRFLDLSPIRVPSSRITWYLWAFLSQPSTRPSKWFKSDRFCKPNASTKAPTSLISPSGTSGSSLHAFGGSSARYNTKSPFCRRYWRCWPGRRPRASWPACRRLWWRLVGMDVVSSILCVSLMGKHVETNDRRRFKVAFTFSFTLSKASQPGKPWRRNEKQGIGDGRMVVILEQCRFGNLGGGQFSIIFYWQLKLETLVLFHVLTCLSWDVFIGALQPLYCRHLLTPMSFGLVWWFAEWTLKVSLLLSLCNSLSNKPPTYPSMNRFVTAYRTVPRFLVEVKMNNSFSNWFTIIKKKSGKFFYSTTIFQYAWSSTNTWMRQASCPPPGSPDWLPRNMYHECSARSTASCSRRVDLSIWPPRQARWTKEGKGHRVRSCQKSWSLTCDQYVATYLWNRSFVETPHANPFKTGDA